MMRHLAFWLVGLTLWGLAGCLSTVSLPEHPHVAVRVAQAPLLAPTTAREPAPPSEEQPEPKPQGAHARHEATGPCLQAAAPTPIDITIPDGTRLQPGEAFTKVWRLRNAGTCPWTQDFAAVWFAGARLGAPAAVPLPATVPPQGTVDIVVEMRAPNQAGHYIGYWKLRAADGTLFGLGPGQGAPFWVEVVVETADGSPLQASLPPTPTRTPPPYASGQVTLTLGQSMDLDTLAPDQADGTDLRLQADAQGVPWLQPLAPAQVGIWGSTRPDREACHRSAMAALPVAPGALNPHLFLCYRTDAGRWGYLRLLAWDAEGILRFEALTWPAPGEE